MTEEVVTLIGRDGDIDCDFGPDGQTVILTRKDGVAQKIKMITTDEVENYEEICAGSYPGLDVFHAIGRGRNLYKGNFLKEVCAYRKEDTWFIFYKEKEKKGGGQKDRNKMLG